MGAKDRKVLKDTVYDVTRHKGMLLKLNKDQKEFGALIDLLRSEDFKNKRENLSFQE